MQIVSDLLFLFFPPLLCLWRGRFFSTFLIPFHCIASSRLDLWGKQSGCLVGGGRFFLFLRRIFFTFDLVFYDWRRPMMMTAAAVMPSQIKDTFFPFNRNFFRLIYLPIYPFGQLRVGILPFCCSFQWKINLGNPTRREKAKVHSMRRVIYTFFILVDRVLIHFFTPNSLYRCCTERGVLLSMYS